MKAVGYYDPADGDVDPTLHFRVPQPEVQRALRLAQELEQAAAPRGYVLGPDGVAEAAAEWAIEAGPFLSYLGPAAARHRPMFD